MNRTIDSKYGKITLTEDESGMGYNVTVSDSSNVLYSGIYIGDPENDSEIISFVTSKIDVPKTDIQKKMDDGVIDLIIDDETISSNIDGWVARHLKSSFKFRKHQKETIISIISNILNSENKNPCHMVEAPTGSGKSLINIISAGVLDEYYGFTSYILCSDLFLWEQYANFLKENPAVRFGCLKGQTGNYTCMLNGEDMRNADCRIANVSWKSLINGTASKLYGYDCCKSCDYVKARRKALNSNVVVMTYQLYLYAINVLYEQSQKNAVTGGLGHSSEWNESAMLKPKDILFCDECHNIPSIVQSHFTPTIKKDDNFYYLQLYRWGIWYNEYEASEGVKSIYDIYPTIEDFEKELNTLYWNFIDEKVNKQLLFDVMKKYYNILCSLNDIGKCAQEYVKGKKQHKDDLISKEDFRIFKTANWMANQMCFWNDFIEAVEYCGAEFVCKDIIEPATKQNEDNAEKYCEIHCIKEDFLCWNYLYKKAKYRVLISATMGGKEAFEENNGLHFSELQEGKLEVVPSTFDFTKSPIFVLNRFKMTLKERKQNLPNIVQIVTQLTKGKFKDERGIIQTGSYDIAKEIYNKVPPEVRSRMLIYRGSREKTLCVKIHQRSKNTILIGPTLNQGMDLPNDQCRFIIVCKVPFPSLGSSLVKEKTRLFRRWYESTTSNEIIQGIGRGVRNETDWCVTYILDASFMELYKATIDQYPEELQDRIQIIG